MDLVADGATKSANQEDKSVAILADDFSFAVVVARHNGTTLRADGDIFVPN